MALLPLVLVGGRAQQIAGADVLGASGLDRNSPGSLTIGSTNATNITLGNPTATISLAGEIDTHIVFKQDYGGSHAIRPGPTSGVSGDTLIIEGGPSTDSVGGTLILAGGSGATGYGSLVVLGGVYRPGDVYIGYSSAFTASVRLGGSGIPVVLDGNFSVYGQSYFYQPVTFEQNVLAYNNPSLGVSGARWGNVYSINGNFSGITTTAILTITSGVQSDLLPYGAAHNIGSSSAPWSGLHVNSATIYNLLTTNALSVTNVVDSHIKPSSNNTYDLGATGLYWRKAYINALELNTPLGLSMGGTGANTRPGALYNIVNGTLTTKGDLLVHNGTSDASTWRVAVPTPISNYDGSTLSVDSSATHGLSYMSQLDNMLFPVGSCLYSSTATRTLTAGRIDWFYVGKIRRRITSVVVHYRVTAVSGGGAGQVAVFTSPDAPKSSRNNMTVRGYVDKGAAWASTTGIYTDTISVSNCTPGLHLWIAFWSASGYTAPTFRVGQHDDLATGIMQYSVTPTTAPSTWPDGQLTSGVGSLATHAPVWVGVRLYPD